MGNRALQVAARAGLSAIEAPLRAKQFQGHSEWGGQAPGEVKCGRRSMLCVVHLSTVHRS